MRPTIAALGFALGILLASQSGRAQESAAAETGHAGAKAPGFGQRASNIVVFEDVFGFYDQTLEIRDTSLKASDPQMSSGTGFFPARVVRLGYHYALDSGLTLGSGFGAW